MLKPKSFKTHKDALSSFCSAFSLLKRLEYERVREARLHIKVSQNRFGITHSSHSDASCWRGDMLWKKKKNLSSMKSLMALVDVSRTELQVSEDL